MNPFRPTFQHFDSPFIEFGLSTTNLHPPDHDGMRPMPGTFDRNIEMGRPDLPNHHQPWGQAREDRLRQMITDTQPQGPLQGPPQGQQAHGQQPHGQQREEQPPLGPPQDGGQSAMEEDEELDRLMTEAEVRVACTCKRYCLDKFDPDTIQAHIFSLKEMEKDEKEMFIMGVLQRYGEEPRGHGQRQRTRFRYVHDDKAVCKTVFCYINDIGSKALRGLKEHLTRSGPVARVHGNKGKKPHHALNYDQVKFCVDFLISYSEIHKLPIPDNLSGQDEMSVLQESPILLPSNLSKAMFHKLYVDACQDTNMKPLGLASFKSVWKMCVPHIKILGPKEDVSDAISKLSASFSAEQEQQRDQAQQRAEFRAQKAEFRAQKAGKRAQKAEYRAQKIRLPATEMTEMGTMGPMGQLGDMDDGMPPNLQMACTCKRYCLEKFDHDAIQAHIQSIREMEKDEKEMFIMGIIQRFGEEPRGHKQRQRTRFRYIHDDKPVCKTIFCYIYDIGNKALRGVKEHLIKKGPVARVHGNKGRKSHHALQTKEVKFVVDYLLSFAELHKLTMPDIPNGHDEESPILLPSSLTKVDVHKQYLEACQESSIRCLGITSFKSVWQNCVPHIKIKERPWKPKRIRNRTPKNKRVPPQLPNNFLPVQ